MCHILYIHTHACIHIILCKCKVIHDTIDILYDTIFTLLFIYNTDIDNDRETQNPQSPCWWALPTLCSGAQINGMTLTGAADPAAGFSGMVRSDEVVMVQGQETFGSFSFSWSGHFCGDFYLTMWRWQSSWTPRISSWIPCNARCQGLWQLWQSLWHLRSNGYRHLHLFRVGGPGISFLDKRRRLSMRWTRTVWVSMSEVAKTAGRKTAFRLKAGATMEFRDISWYLPFSRTENFNKVEWWSTMEFRDISHSPTDVLAATCAAGWTSTDSARLKVFLHVTWWPWLDQGLSPSNAPNLVAGWDCNVELCKTGWITADDENSMEPQSGLKVTALRWFTKVGLGLERWKLRFWKAQFIGILIWTTAWSRIGVGSWIRIVWIHRVSESMQTRLGYIQFHAVLQSFCHGLAVDFSHWCWQIEVLDFFLVLAQILEEFAYFGQQRALWRTGSEKAGVFSQGLDPRHTGLMPNILSPVSQLVGLTGKWILGQKVFWLDQVQVHVQGFEILDSFQVPLSLDWKV